ncbi:MAG: hypothetical protein ACTHZW_04390 [Microbacteriaceae bacterium]|uniref:hypothetical protein n=1 Tax=Microbacterium sp. TaxID=51671 RepID=UPI003F961D62
MTRLRPAAAASLVVLLALTGLLSACAPGDDASTASPTASESVETPGISLAELEVAEVDLAVGDVLTVLVDTPGVSWRAESSDPLVLEVDDPGSGDATRNVSITAVAEGSASLVFTGDGDEAYEVIRELDVSE